jgi:hypothetical protein
MSVILCHLCEALHAVKCLLVVSLLLRQGTISFPIFVLHGALGQLFYKKIIATKVWGSVMPLSFFPAYCAIVLLSAAAVQKFFLVSFWNVVWGLWALQGEHSVTPGLALLHCWVSR